MKLLKLALSAAMLFTVPSTVLGIFVEYSTSVDVYLDPNTSGGAGTDDTRWELSSAVNQKTCTHRRDFIFTCGWYITNKEWVCSASNNSVGWPKNPDRSPFTISTAGWYTFRHTFNIVSGVLSVDMEILQTNTDTVLKTWTLSNPSDTESMVEGNRYGWFVTLGCTQVSSGSCTGYDSTFKLAIDNSQKCIKDGPCDFFQGFEEDTEGWVPFGGQIERVSSNTNNIFSSSGNFHAEVKPGANGSGVFTRWGGYSCDDNLECTENDVCTAGVCAGTALDCTSFDDDCNDGVCIAGECQAAPKEDGTDCDDNDDCTENDVCTTGVCAGTEIRDFYYWKCGKALFLCGLDKDDFEQQGNGYLIGNEPKCNTGAVNDDLVIDREYPKCLDDAPPSKCPKVPVNGKLKEFGLSNYGFVSCRDRGCIKFEV